MTDKEILDLIKMKREYVYKNYQYIYNQAKEQGIDKSFIKDKMNELATEIKTYDDLIIIINLNTKREKYIRELKDTISLMTSADYKERFIAEYLQVKIRHNKLLSMLMKWDNGKLGYKLSCPRSLFNKQITGMNTYLDVLEERAKIEKIDLEQYKI